MGTDLTTFDYGDLAPPDATALEKHAERIDALQVKTRRIAAEAVIAVGKELKAAHERLAGKGREGMFRPWVQERCGFGKSTAYKAMAVFDAFGKCPQHGHLFDVEALYLLSAPKCPEEATTEAIQRAEKGERITHKVAKELKGEDVKEEDTYKTWCRIAAKLRGWAKEHGAPFVLDFLEDLVEELTETKEREAA